MILQFIQAINSLIMMELETIIFRFFSIECSAWNWTWSVHKIVWIEWKKRNYNNKQQYEHWKIEFYINTNIIEKRAQLP